MLVRHQITATLPLEAGGTLEKARIVFHTSERRRGKVIWICHALTANSNPEDWWPEMVGPGKPLDTERNFIVCVNMLGSPYGSEGPARDNPATGKPWLLDFPKITIRDLVSTLELVRKKLEINKIDLLVGSSIGGFQALEWAVSCPNLFCRCAFIATAPRISPYAGATVETQIMALEADPTFREAASVQGGTAGLKCARAQALISYRCFRGYGIRQQETDPDTLFSDRSGSYQRYQGEKLVRRDFDAYSYYTLCLLLKSHNVGRGRGGVAEALRRIKADVTVAAIDTDNLFPPEEGRQWARLIPGAQYIEFTSAFGHDGFLLETAKLAALLM